MFLCEPPEETRAKGQSLGGASRLPAQFEGRRRRQIANPEPGGQLLRSQEGTRPTCALLCAGVAFTPAVVADSFPTSSGLDWSCVLCLAPWRDA